MKFEFATSSGILFGPGRIREAAAAARRMGKRVLLVTGSSADRHGSFLRLLRSSGLSMTAFSLAGEPDVARIQEGVDLARHTCDLVIALGGGSAIDAGKVIAALLTNVGRVMDYLEVIGNAQPLTHPSLPFIAIPTTSGTGSEVTRNAVLASRAHGVKASLRSPFLLPKLAVIDPELMYDLPPAVTASTGLDALTQVIEPYVSIRANPVTDALCLEGMRRAVCSLCAAFRNGRDLSARADMALVSLFGGMALTNAGLGVVHGFAAPIGGMFEAPHGAVCAALLGPGMEANIRALRKRAPENDRLERFRVVAASLTGKPDAVPEDGPAIIRDLCAEFSITSLRTYGIGMSDVDVLVDKALSASSMKGNPVALTRSELADLLIQAIG
jgi:alcohol dehydrogenase class IV